MARNPSCACYFSGHQSGQPCAGKPGIGNGRDAEFGAVNADIVLDERAKFFPTDAALASWMAQADRGQAHIVYE